MVLLGQTVTTGVACALLTKEDYQIAVANIVISELKFSTGDSQT